MLLDQGEELNLNEDELFNGRSGIADTVRYEIVSCDSRSQTSFYACAPFKSPFSSETHVQCFGENAEILMFEFSAIKN